MSSLDRHWGYAGKHNGPVGLDLHLGLWDRVDIGDRVAAAEEMDALVVRAAESSSEAFVRAVTTVDQDIDMAEKLIADVHGGDFLNGVAGKHDHR